MLLNNWKNVTLGDVAKYSNTRISTNKLTLENYISTENMLPDKGGKTSASSIPNGSAIKYEIGQTLISNIRPYFKKIWQATIDGGCSADVLVFDIIDDIDKKYFFYYLSQDHFFEYVMAGAKGTKMPRGDKQQILKYSFRYPKKDEQKAIAATLSCLDDKIELNNQINKNLEEMAQAIFKSWFVDFEPFQDGEFEDSELGRIPKRWRVLEFSEMSTVQNGYAFKSTDYQADGCKLIRTTNIGTDGFVDNVDLVNLPYNFLSDTKYENFKFEPFDTVLVMVGASVGKIGLITEKNVPSLQNQNMWRFRPILNNVSPIYIYYTVKLINDRVKNWSSGSAREFYRKDSFQRAMCLYPREEVLMEFKKLVDPIFGLISINLLKNENLKDIRDSLLPKLMSSEIQVPIKEVK